MPRHRVLGTGGADGEAWSELVARLPDGLADLHFLPDYARIYERTYGVEARLAVCGDQDAYVIYPFTLRPLDDLPFVRETGLAGTFLDSATAYGYGGPAWVAPDRDRAGALFGELLRHHRDYLRARGAASEFVCLHPLLANQDVARSGGAAPRRQKDVVWVDLTGASGTPWEQMSPSGRRAVNLARRAGLVVARDDPDPAFLADFHRRYLDTMVRVGARDRWFFPEDYFSNCLRCLGPAGCSFWSARLDGAVAATFQLLHHRGTVYYHFAGNNLDFFDKRPNNLLMHEVIAWAAREGFARFHLGGGVGGGADDGLLRFKMTFSRRTAPLYTYGYVADEANYARLCQAKRAHERQTTGRESESDFFPLYRR